MPFKISENEFRIYQSGRQLVVKAVFAFLMVALSIWLFNVDTSDIKTSGNKYAVLIPLAKPIALGLGFFCLWIAIGSLLIFRMKTPSVVIDEKGIRLKSDYLLVEDITWSHVLGIVFREVPLNVNGNDIGTASVAQFKVSKSRGWIRFLTGGRADLFEINFYQLGVSPSKCEKWLKEFHASKNLLTKAS
ncbi:MAG: hypothetical protein IT287_02095 [Bdellovibrionaceae bacterium]|nr:hypothetical protein [Pseudobdellovibrionaceae bacterium]